MIDHMPVEFDFYGVGKVEKKQSHEFLQSSYASSWLACRIVGEIQGIITLTVPHECEDVSIYEEILNILASQWATAQSKFHQIDVMIETPKLIQESLLKQITTQRTYAQSYVYQFQEKILTAHILITGMNQYDQTRLDLS